MWLGDATVTASARLPCWFVLLVLLQTAARTTCGEDAVLRARVYSEYPLLDPNHPLHDGVSDWDEVCMLREFSYRHTAYSNRADSESCRAGVAEVELMLAGRKSLADVYEFFDQSKGGVLCGHAAHLLQRLYTEFGHQAWYLGCGFSPPTPKGSKFTHAQTLVQISVQSPEGESRPVLTLHDPSVNLSYIDAKDQSPLDYYELLRRLTMRRAETIAHREAIQETSANWHPATVCLEDETAGTQPEDFVASWNVDEDHQWTDLGQGRWRFESPRSRANFERLGDHWWKKELAEEGVPGETVYLHAFPFRVAGAPAAASILDRALAIVGRRETNEAAQPSSDRPADILPGEWLGFRRDPSLLGRSPANGKIVETPQIAWKHFVGRKKWSLLAEPAATNHTLALADSMLQTNQDWKDPASEWFPGEPGAAGDRVGPPVDKNQTTAYADVLPEIPGMEKVVFASGFETPTRNGQWQYGPGRLLAREDGTWRTVWETEPLEHCFRPRPLIGDFDRDGELEIAVLPWRALLIYDARTGELEQQCEFTKGRSYGLFGVYDFDQDGTSEFLIMADYSKHIDVLGYRDGQLMLFWQQEIELDFEYPEKILRVLAEPVADLNGDGLSEVVFNVFNQRGEGKWRLIVRDGMTGERRCELTDEIAESAVDLDGDGAWELLTTAVVGQHPKRAGTIRVRRVAPTSATWKLTPLWQGESMAWQQVQLPAVSHQQYGTYAGRVGVMIHPATPRADSVAVIRKQSGESRSMTDRNRALHVVTAKWIDGGFQELLELSSASLEPIALRSDGGLLVDAVTDPGQRQELVIRNGQIRLIANSLTPSYSLPPPSIAWAAGHSHPTVVAQGFGSQLVAFVPPKPGNPATELWRLPGRSPSKSWPAVFQPVVGSLFGDGRRQLILADEGPSGAARLTVVDLESTATLWQQEFPRFAGSPPKWNHSGLLFWQPGHFTDANQQDLLVTVRRSIMHSDETVLLSGVDGRRIWRRDRQMAGRGCGGQPYAIADFDGDGLDDAASMYTHLRYILDGPTGGDLLAKENHWPQIPINTVYWMQPVAGSFDGSGRSSLLCTTTRRQMVGRITADGNLVWSDAYDRAANGFPAIGDFDGDGSLEAIFVGFEDGTRCYDASTGALEWTLNLAPGQDVQSAVSADLDSDGKDEAVFTLNQTLYCIGVDEKRQCGEVAWTVELPTQIGDPVIADVPHDQSGQGSCLSILVAGRDGHIYCVR